jgi:YD repeat-containing protein
VAYQYDLASRRTRITWPDAFYAAYEYDVAGALVAVRENGATSGPGVLAFYAYDDRGRRASVTRGNGVVTTYAYDSASRLDVLSHDLSGTGNDLALDFSYNSAGQIVARDRTSANGSCVYPQPAANADAYVSNGLNAPHFGHLKLICERQSSAISRLNARSITGGGIVSTWPFVRKCRPGGPWPKPVICADCMNSLR